VEPMNSVLQKLRERLSQRSDSEHGQAFVRIAVLSIVLVYLLVRGTHDLQPQAHGDVMVLVLLGFVVGIGLIGWIFAVPDASNLRRGIGMLADYGLMGAAMIRMGEPLAWVYVLLMWVTIGNGLRYGIRFLIGSMAM